MGSSGNLKLTNSEMGLSGNQVFGVTKEVQMQNVFEDRNKGLATSCITFDENVSEILWENKEEESLVESTVESSADDCTHVLNFPDFRSKREFIVEEFDSSWIFDGKLGTRKISDTDGNGSVCERMHKMEETTKCAMKIKVIDETAVIETTPVCEAGNGIGNERGFMASAKHAEGNVHKSVMKQETDEKQGKRSRRRAKGVRKLPGTNGTENFLNHTAEIQNGFRKKGDETKRTYSRTEMEALRFVNLEAQQKKWAEIYCGLAPNVARGYDGLIDCNIQKHIQINFDPRQQFGKKKKNIPGVLGEDFSYCPIRDDEINNSNPLNPVCNLGDGVDGECSEEDDSEEDYSSMQRPAFVVTGEPNFDSGPPKDGFEYLRRVRWEAAQVPKVKVAKLERNKLKKEQTAYMPIIPDIEKCPEHLLALKEWEDAFILDFSKLRLALSHLEESSAGTSVEFPFSSSIHPGESSNQLPETIMSETINELITGGDESFEALDCSTPENSSNPQSFPLVNENNASPVLENATSKSSVCGNSSNSPTLSAILGMDSVARLSMMRKRIKLVENVSTLSRNDGTWLFALCAAIDTPLDAETCANMRCLLRKCASLRAGKSELDDEVAMLNILATITGKYFGQSEF